MQRADCIMMHLLKRHPFAVKAFFEYSAVLTYALPAEALRPLLAPGLTLDERKGRGFAAIAMVKTRSLRPAVFPEFIGQDFFLIGYRIFARFQTQAGKRLRGLRILKSETDSRRMVVSGNLLTHYNYHYVPVQAVSTPETLTVHAKGLDAVFHKQDNASLPASSVFADWREARMYAGPLPFTFDYEEQTNSIVVIEGVRENWEPRPVEAEAATDFFKDKMFGGAPAVLSSAFLIENVPYMWKPGRREPCAGGPD
jgi:hypothetical protein